MITAAAVFAGVRALWLASADLAARVPGGLWAGKPEQAADVPYAVADLALTGREWTSGLALYTFELTLSVWSTAGATDAGAIEAALHLTFRQGRAAHLAVAGATRAVQMMPTTGEVKDDGRHDARDVRLTAGKWRLILEGPE